MGRGADEQPCPVCFILVHIAHALVDRRRFLRRLLLRITCCCIPADEHANVSTRDHGYLRLLTADGAPFQFVPYASVNGVTIGLVTTTIRFWVYQHSADGPVAVATGGPHTASSSGRYASPLPTAPRSIDLGRFLLNEDTGELYYRVRLAGALSIKRVSPNRARGLGARTRTFSLFEPSPAAAAEGLPGVSVSHVVIEDTPLLSRGPGGRLCVGSSGGQGVYGDWRNRPLTSVIDFSGFSAALGRMAGLFGACIRGALSGLDVGAIADGVGRTGPFPIHTCDIISPLEEVWGAPRPRGGTGFGGDELASVVAVVAAAVTHPGGWAAAWAGTWAGTGGGEWGASGEEPQAALAAANPPSAASLVVAAAQSPSAAESAVRPASPLAAEGAAAKAGPEAARTPPPKGDAAGQRRSRRRRERAAARARRAAAAARPPGAVEDTSAVVADGLPVAALGTAAAAATATAAAADGDAASESDDRRLDLNRGCRASGNLVDASSTAAARGADAGVVNLAEDEEEVQVHLSERHVRAFANLFEGSEESVPSPT